MLECIIPLCFLLWFLTVLLCLAYVCEGIFALHMYIAVAFSHPVGWVLHYIIEINHRREEKILYIEFFNSLEKIAQSLKFNNMPKTCRRQSKTEDRVPVDRPVDWPCIKVHRRRKKYGLVDYPINWCAHQWSQVIIDRPPSRLSRRHNWRLHN